jgi:DNA polymerase I
MVVAVDVRDDAVELWSRTDDGVVCERDEDYRSTCYVDASDEALAWLADRLTEDPKVVGTDDEHKYTSLQAHRDGKRARVLAVTMERPSEVATFAREVRAVHEPAGDWPPGRFRLYDVDISPKFRYCLAAGVEPMPADVERVRSLTLSLPTRELAAENLAALTCEGERREPSERASGSDRRERHASREGEGLGDDERGVLEALAARLRERDPDVLVLSSADLVPLVHDRAAALDVDCQLGRRPGHRQLAGANTFESYGRVGHSPARYDVPGRAIVDRSNSFFWREGGLAGLFDLVRRSWKPLQESAWASIGTVFTAMQIHEATSRDVLVPWRPWEPEAFTAARTLHDADRGGVTFEPDVGLHADVVEVDFASLYPNVMCVHDLSPETVRCDCHDTEDVPRIGYSVCPDVEEPFVPSVLRGLIDDRAGYKDELAACRERGDDQERAERLESKISALKWILVTCFGYQGYRNSKFGRIEVHESINAVARELLLDAKATLEAAGWRVVHGIVDSLWTTARTEDPAPIRDVCATVTDDAGIALEYEAAFDWVAFVPRRDGTTGALNRYFGRRADGGYKLRGIECRQRSTPAFVATVQEALVETLDAAIESEGVAGGRALAEPVCDRLARAVAALERGDVAPEDLVIRTRATRALADYDQRTRTVAALERYRAAGIERRPGQDVRYVVVDDDRRDRDRVCLPWETGPGYDAAFYETLLVRAAESVLAPIGWDRSRIRRYLADGRDLRLSAFG